MAKALKKVVRYKDRPFLGKKCSDCVCFVRPDHCQAVAGRISPNGSCRSHLAAEKDPEEDVS